MLGERVVAFARSSCIEAQTTRCALSLPHVRLDAGAWCAGRLHAERYLLPEQRREDIFIAKPALARPHIEGRALIDKIWQLVNVRKGA